MTCLTDCGSIGLMLPPHYRNDCGIRNILEEHGTWNNMAHGTIYEYNITLSERVEIEICLSVVTFNLPLLSIQFK